MVGVRVGALNVVHLLLNRGSKNGTSEVKSRTCLHSDDLVMLGILVSKHICRKVHLNWVIHNQSLLNAGATRVSVSSNLNAVPRKLELLGDVGDDVLCKRLKGAGQSACSGELLTIGNLSWVKGKTVNSYGKRSCNLCGSCIVFTNCLDSVFELLVVGVSALKLQGNGNFLAVNGNVCNLKEVTEARGGYSWISWDNNASRKRELGGKGRSCARKRNLG